MTAPVLAQSKAPAARLAPGRALTLTGIADGAEGLVVADLARSIAAGAKPPAISMAVICRDGSRMAMLSRALGFFAPDIETIEFPAWDCLPYDRVSPHADVVAQRMAALARLARAKGDDRPAIVLTTVNAILQRVVPRESVATRLRRSGLARQLTPCACGVDALSGRSDSMELHCLGCRVSIHGSRLRPMAS